MENIQVNPIKEKPGVGFVYSYNNDPHKRTIYPARQGDKIEWKRNGSRGHVNAKVIGYSEERHDYVLVENWLPNWQAPYTVRATVWIKKSSVSIVRDEKYEKYIKSLMVNTL